MTPGYDTALVRMDPTGEVIVTTGTCGHGQGHETTFAQIVADRLGIHPDQVRLRQGDTDLASYGWGTWGSRSVVIGGGAAGLAADAVAERLRKIAAGQLEASPADIELAGGAARVRGDESASIPIAELARLVHFQAHRVDEDLRYALEERATFDPPGTFSNACHAAMVVIDPGTGAIRLHRYLVVEDCGVVINPVVVDGQVRGGVTQGVAAALLERVCFDAEGQPVSTTLMDYLAPTAAEMCPVDIVHLETPSRFSETGAKGMGEGGTIGAPAAVLNAVNDALSGTGIRFDHIPVLPHEVSAALSEAAVQRGRGMTDTHTISLRVNGREHELTVEARRTLADMLRHDLGYTGTHLGCEHGICGACTVLMDGQPVRACLVFGVQADGTEVRTVEGLADGEQLSDLQQAFSDHHALQCGFCTPGFLMLAEAYLAETLLADDRRGRADGGAGPRARRVEPVPVHRLPGHHRGDRGHRPGPAEMTAHRRPAAASGGPAPAARARPVRRRLQRPGAAVGPGRPLPGRSRRGPRARRRRGQERSRASPPSSRRTTCRGTRSSRSGSPSPAPT